MEEEKLSSSQMKQQLVSLQARLTCLKLQHNSASKMEKKPPDNTLHKKATKLKAVEAQDMNSQVRMLDGKSHCTCRFHYHSYLLWVSCFLFFCSREKNNSWYINWWNGWPRHLLLPMKSFCLINYIPQCSHHLDSSCQKFLFGNINLHAWSLFVKLCYVQEQELYVLKGWLLLFLNQTLSQLTASLRRIGDVCLSHIQLKPLDCRCSDAECRIRMLCCLVLLQTTTQG